MEQTIILEQQTSVESELSRKPRRAQVISEEFAEMPVIDFQVFLASQEGGSTSEQAQIECQKVAECLHKFGILIIRDPRVNM